MKFSLTLFASLLASTVAAGVVEPPSPQRQVRYRAAEPDAYSDTTPSEDLWKRRGGGGGGGGRGGGGGSGGSRGGGGGSSGGSRGGSKLLNLPRPGGWRKKQTKKKHKHVQLVFGGETEVDVEVVEVD